MGKRTKRDRAHAMDVAETTKKGAAEKSAKPPKIRLSKTVLKQSRRQKARKNDKRRMGEAVADRAAKKAVRDIAKRERLAAAKTLW